MKYIVLALHPPDPLRLPPASSEFPDGARHSRAAAYRRYAEREPAGSSGVC